MELKVLSLDANQRRQRPKRQRKAKLWARHLPHRAARKMRLKNLRWRCWRRQSLGERFRGGSSRNRIPFMVPLPRTNRTCNGQFRSHLPDSVFVADLAASARRMRSRAFIRWHCFSKFGRGPFQRRSLTESKTGTSSRRVASLRNSKASLHEWSSDSDSPRALRIDGCHCRQSFGMSSRWRY